jgi:thymidylate kinase
MTKILRSSEINVIAHLLSETELFVVVFGLPENFSKDDEHDYLLIPFQGDLKTIFDHKRAQKTCLINNSGKRIEIRGFDFLVEFETDASYQFKNKTVLHFISNPDGSMRWLYPAGIRKPWFLSFYNFTYWKAAAYKMLVKFLFFFRLSGFLSKGSLVIHSDSNPFFAGLLGTRAFSNNHYSIFTGTYGPNRKILMARASGRKIDLFFKIALNEKSRLNIENETTTLLALADDKLPGICVPTVRFTKEGVLGLNNIKPAVHYTEYLFGNLQAACLKTMYETGSQKIRFRNLSICAEIRSRLISIRNHPQYSLMPDMKGILEKMCALHAQLEQKNDLIPVARNHGDFTRWNCYLDNENIYVYDWELSKINMPLLHDLFHFVIQVAIFSVHADFAEVDARIAAALALVRVQKLIADYEIDPLLHLQLYLLENVSYYLNVYLDQEKTGPEVQLQLRTWNHLLFTHSSFQDTVSQRKGFISGLFDALVNENYVVLKNSGKTMEALSDHSDIDLLVSRDCLKYISKWIKNRNNIQKVVFIRKSFMTTVQVYFMDNSFLSIDLLISFHRKSIEYLPSAYLLQKAVLQNGIKILPPAYDYLYIFIFYQINNSDLPSKYSRQYDQLSASAEFPILQQLKEQFDVDSKSVSDTFVFQKSKREKLLGFLKSKKENNFFRRMIRFGRYLAGQFMYLIKPDGFMLTFSGVDGAGKSTIIQEVKEMMENKYRRKVVVIRHRPSILPILSAWKYGKAEADKKCVESLPRMGNNNSRFSSLLRFGYYYADYFFGQIVIYFKYTVRGYVVLYDRYYFDFIVDARRSNINVNRSFIKGLFHFVYKPELNIFLYALPEVILKRKKELSAEDIRTLTSSYQHLFDELGNKPRYICIENIDRHETVAQIEQAFIHLN